VLIDRSHERWAVAVIATTFSAIAAYRLVPAPAGVPPGLTPIGMALGAAAGALLLFCAALGARRRMPAVRAGAMGSWLRAHIWLGLLSWPLVLLHAGFRAGGPLTRALLVLEAIVVVSGVAGALLQHAIPRLMSDELSDERTLGTLGRVRRNLALDAYDAVANACGPIAEALPLLATLARETLPEVPLHRRGLEATAFLERLAAAQAQGEPSTRGLVPIVAGVLRVLPASAHGRAIDAALRCAAQARAPLAAVDGVLPLARAIVGGAALPGRRAAAVQCFRTIAQQGGLAAEAKEALGLALAEALPAEEREGARGEMARLEIGPRVPPEREAPGGNGRSELRELYVRTVLPYLREPRAPSRLASPAEARIFFETAAPLLPEDLRPALGALEASVKIARSTVRQERLQLLLAAWLVVHVPAAYALVALAAVHAVAAHYY
jgi:hypothetical protein